MRLLVITTPHLFPDEAVLLTTLFEEGMERLHLRKPEANETELATLLEQIPATFHPRIVLHDHFALVNCYAIGGIHLNSRNTTVPEGFQGSISRSCHSLQELTAYSSLDYLFLSPLFESISKEGYGNGFPMQELQEATLTGIINEKVIALGGISEATLPLLRPFGFGGVAVLGALWGKAPSLAQKKEIINQYKMILQCLNKRT